MSEVTRRRVAGVYAIAQSLLCSRFASRSAQSARLALGLRVLRVVVVDDDNARVLQDRRTHEDGGARPVVGVFLVEAGADVHLAGVDGMPERVAVPREALSIARGHTRQ